MTPNRWTEMAFVLAEPEARRLQILAELRRLDAA